MLDYTANSSHQDKQQKQQTSHELTERPREPVLYLHRCSSSLTDLWSSLLHVQEETLRLNQQDNITICDLKQEPVAKQNSETTSRASSPTPIPLGNSYSENSSISEPNVVGRGSGRVQLSLHHWSKWFPLSQDPSPHPAHQETMTPPLPQTTYASADIPNVSSQSQEEPAGPGGNLQEGPEALSFIQPTFGCPIPKLPFSLLSPAF